MTCKHLNQTMWTLMSWNHIVMQRAQVARLPFPMPCPGDSRRPEISECTVLLCRQLATWCPGPSSWEGSKMAGGVIIVRQYLRSDSGMTSLLWISPPLSSKDSIFPPAKLPLELSKGRSFRFPSLPYPHKKQVATDLGILKVSTRHRECHC